MNNAIIDVDVQTRIAKASISFGKFERRLWRSHDINLRVKVYAYKTVELKLGTITECT